MTSIKFRALTHEDHKLFFEALGEYGKDFGNIQQYMAQKSGKINNKSNTSTSSSCTTTTSTTLSSCSTTTATTNLSTPNSDYQKKKEQDKKEDDRKREQIRNFYNKLHTKLSQLIDYKVDDRIEKVNQELYLLINYGEIWKKHGFKFKFDDKTKKLLKELVFQGYTTYRFKNKNVRLRTPPCRALKKINEIGIDEKVKVVTTRELPKDVVVELYPATNGDWLRVQSLSQNPRVRAKLSIQKRISKLLEFLEGKWNIEPDFIRLKPSAHHELKEVNITRVIPDNHLDLSLNAYINRLGQRMDKTNHKNDKDSQLTSHNLLGQIEISQSRLSLIGSPDNSTLPEQSIARTRKHLNLLQSLTGSLENCESRTAHEAMDDGHSNHTNQASTNNNNVTITAALCYDDAVASAHDSRSVDFQIPKNVTLGEYFKMAGGGGGDESKNAVVNETDGAEQNNQKVEDEDEDCNDDSNLMRTHIMKLAEGWTRQDMSSITIGELYLAFKCPEKIILEYTIETCPRQQQQSLALSLDNGNDINQTISTNVSQEPIVESGNPIQKSPSNDILIFKLLTAASLSLAHIERQKQEQQHKSLEQQQQTCSKFKRRKVPCQQTQQTMTLHDIEVTNQSVKEALKQLQPTRLSSYRRAR